MYLEQEILSDENGRSSYPSLTSKLEPEWVVGSKHSCIRLLICVLLLLVYC